MRHLLHIGKSNDQCLHTWMANIPFLIIDQACAVALDDHCHHEGISAFVHGVIEAELAVEFHRRP